MKYEKHKCIVQSWQVQLKFTVELSPACRPRSSLILQLNRGAIFGHNVAPNGTNPRIFQVKFQYILAFSKRVPDLSHFWPIWPTLGPNLTPLKLTCHCASLCQSIAFISNSFSMLIGVEPSIQELVFKQQGSDRHSSLTSVMSYLLYNL